ncbi:MAG: glycosyltransferase family 39 protein [Phycisphaerales bacterium]|nr:MAG: glycosyltransferase family 39 protein [Phycisphaerales bacterium]
MMRSAPVPGEYVDIKRSSRWLNPPAVIVFALILYLPGIRWGLPGTISWSQDTIAGLRTLGAVTQWPDNWPGRYPPLQYLLLNAAYKPVLYNWQRSGEFVVEPGSMRIDFKPPHPPKIGLLILIARFVSVAMAITAALGLRAAVRQLTDDELAATLAAGAMMIGAAFTYFAHLGNVDVPSMCWFAWSVYFYVRLIKRGRWPDAALLGLFGSLAISTKDAVAGVYPGMALVLLALETNRRVGNSSRGKALLQATWQLKWLIGLAAFIIPYVLLYNILADPQEYLERMRYWLDPAAGTLHARQHRYGNQLQLLLATISYTAGAVGWPMLAAMAASAVYALRRHARIAFIVLVPAVSYYLLVIVQIDFVYSRFLFAPLSLLCILLGVSAAALIRSRRCPLLVRFGIPLAVACLSLGYAAAVDLEMITDSRYQAEKWFQGNIVPSSSVGAFSNPQYLPRVHDLGYATYPVEMSPEAFTRPQPEYLILTSYNYEDFNDEQKACMKELISGRLGYDPVVGFRGRYLGTASSALSIAGWGALPPGKISPEITILRRTVP